MTERPRYRQGRILWARLRARGGRKQLHPCAIISADRDITQPEDFDPRKDIDAVNAVAVIGISTKFKKYPPYVLLPYSSDLRGHLITKLTEQCAACIGWYDWVVLEDDVEGCGGDVPSAEMNQIMGAVTIDLQTKLAAEALELHRLIALLIGHP